MLLLQQPLPLLLLQPLPLPVHAHVSRLPLPSLPLVLPLLPAGIHQQWQLRWQRHSEQHTT
jgi:hypothetical protein